MSLSSANMSGLMPITRLAGDILRELSDSQMPQPKYKYYM